MEARIKRQQEAQMQDWKIRRDELIEAIRKVPELFTDEHIFQGKMKLYYLRERILSMSSYN